MKYARRFKLSSSIKLIQVVKFNKRFKNWSIEIKRYFTESSNYRKNDKMSYDYESTLHFSLDVESGSSFKVGASLPVDGISW